MEAMGYGAMLEANMSTLPRLTRGSLVADRGMPLVLQRASASPGGIIHLSKRRGKRMER